MYFGTVLMTLFLHTVEITTAAEVRLPLIFLRSFPVENIYGVIVTLG